ncbi:hypothetical protein [Streptomyces sp. RK75]|uniref:hypothetical protein n=1 Tax=Streptomyces sp. RK75 TaxID=2824895 RepID=UPI001B3581EF|nr:hypothetical protein [Streptomyces sp. RK75]MBQ0867348.1 hypothetical protein [Streptomyces sp. RK75]
MANDSADDAFSYTARLFRRLRSTISHLRGWSQRHGRELHAQFVYGAAHKLGSGAVTLLILWWQTRH